ncbi:hypothetical protein [Dyella sedimenti]|jgi:hypothetical protein|uniref:hypothetical protein n=1 Tax=Dyella sedimenti TaxID=2919947 RepID=UPI001FAB03A1|nr:hypothetical protein [Dyella sedimenti]
MANEFRPLAEVLRELKALVQQKTSGFFFIATESNNSSIIRLREGQIDDVAFSRYHSDEAVQHLARVGTARARFQPGLISTSLKRMPLSETTLQWLLGGFEGDAPPTPSASSASPPAKAVGSDEEWREIVSQVALSYLGPIAPLLCDEAFAAAGDIEQALAQIATNMATDEESRRFLAEARSALGKGK